MSRLSQLDCYMEFGVIGISHQEAEIEKRETASFSDTQKLLLYDQILNIGIRQAMILITCNRSELYFLYEQEEQAKQASIIFAHLTASLTEEDLFFKQSQQALLYLFEVCGGYHSMVPGEDQILGQMKQAYEFSIQAGTCGKVLHKIMQSCFACIKQIKHTYKISEISTSIGYLAYQYLKQQTTIAGCKVLMIGSGEMAQLMLTYLQKEPVQIYLCSRKKHHADALAGQKTNIVTVLFEARYECCKDCDLIISATSSPHLMLKKEQYPQITKEQYLLDLASPRDIDDQLQNDHRHIYNLDDLQQMADDHRKERKRRMELAHQDIERHVEDLQMWMLSAPVDAAIESLQKRSEVQAEHTFALLQKKLCLAPHEERIIRNILKASFLRMVKEPILVLKELETNDQAAYLAMIKTLFRLEDETCNIS